MTTDILISCIDSIRENIKSGEAEVEEIIVTLSTGEKIHIKNKDIDSGIIGGGNPFLSFCDWNDSKDFPELWYHTFFDGKMAFRAIAAEYIVMIDVIYTE